METSYTGREVSEDDIRTDAYMRWKYGPGQKDDADTNWEMARRRLGLPPMPTKAETRERAYKTSLAQPGADPVAIWCQVEAKLVEELHNDWHQQKTRQLLLLD